MTRTEKISIKDISLIGIFAAITAVLSPFVIPLPFTPVPVSLSLLAVYIAGLMLRPKQACLSQIIFLLLGAVGLPVFSKFTGGLGVVLGPTGGYLAAYPLMAFLISWLLTFFEKKIPQAGSLLSSCYTALALLLGTLVCYVLGTHWLSYVTNVSLSKALAMAVYPFLPLDLIKIFVTTIAVLPIRKRFKAMHNLPAS